MTTLRKLTNDMVELQTMLESLQTMEDKDSKEYREREQAIIDTIDSINPLIEDKVDGYCSIIHDIEGDIEKIKKEIERLRRTRKTMENNIAWLKANLMFSLKQQGLKKVKTSFNRCSIRTAGQRSLELLVEPEKLPEGYFSVEYKADKKALKKLLETQGKEENQYAKLLPATEMVSIS